MPSSSSLSASPLPWSARQATLSSKQRLASISIDEEVRRSEGGGVAVPMDASSMIPVASGAVGRVRGSDAGSDSSMIPLHRRRGSLSRHQPDASLRLQPSPGARTGTLSTSPVRSEFHEPAGPAAPSATFSPGCSLARSASSSRTPLPPLSTPTAEHPPDAVNGSGLAPSPVIPPPRQASSSQGGFTFPLPIPSPSLPFPSVPSSTAESNGQPSRSLPTLPILHVRTASGQDIGPPPAQLLPIAPRAVFPRGPSQFRGLGRRPSTSGTPSPTREIFWGGQGGSARRTGAAVTPSGGNSSAEEGGSGVTTPGGSVRSFKPLPSPLADFKLNEHKMLNVRARVATPKGERSAFINDAPNSCPPLHSPLPSTFPSPSPDGPRFFIGSSSVHHDAGYISPPERTSSPAPRAQAHVSPPDPSARTSSFSIVSAGSKASELSTASGATANTAALDTPSTADSIHPAPAMKHYAPITRAPPSVLISVKPAAAEQLEDADGEENEETGTLPPLPNVQRSRQSSTSSSSRSDGNRHGGERTRRRPSIHSALKLNLTDDERIGQAQSKISNFYTEEQDGYESDDLLSSYPGSAHRLSQSSISRKGSTPLLVADLRKGSNASYRSFSSMRSEPFAYDDGWSGSDDSDEEAIPLPRPRASFSRSSSDGLSIPAMPVSARRPSVQDSLVAESTPSQEMTPGAGEAPTNRSSSLPVPLPSPASTRSDASSATARPLSQGDSSSSFIGQSESTASGYFPDLKPARSSSIFSLSGDGTLVSPKGKVLPRPKRVDKGIWGDVEIAYAGGSDSAKWEKAAERLPDRRNQAAEGRRESATSVASSQASRASSARTTSSAASFGSSGSAVLRSAMKKSPSTTAVGSALQRARAVNDAPPSRSIPIRRTTSGSQLHSAASPSSGSSLCLPSPALKKQQQQQRSPTTSPAASPRSIDLPAIEPLRITRPAGQMSPVLSSGPAIDKPLPAEPGTPSAPPRASGLPTRAPPKPPIDIPSATPVTAREQQRTPEPAALTVVIAPTPPTSPASAHFAPSSAASTDLSKSLKPAFGPAAGRRMSKRPSASAAPRPSPQSHFYSAPPLPPLPPLPVLPPALASQR